MGSEDNVPSYSTICDLTQQMLEAAQSGDWEKLADLEQTRNKLARDLAARNREHPVPPTDADAEIIRKIMASDQEIRTLTEVRLTELKAVLDSVNTERKLFKAYDPGT